MITIPILQTEILPSEEVKCPNQITQLKSSEMPTRTPVFNF